MIWKPQQNNHLTQMCYWRPRVVTISSRYVLRVRGNPQQVQTRNPKVLLAPQSGCKETLQKPEIYPKSKTKTKKQQTL